MQVTPPLPLLRRVPSGLWTALAWCAGLALTFLMRVRLPGEAEPAYSPGALLYRWDGLSFLIVATALVVAGSILLDRRPLPALTLLLAASAVACMPLGVGEIPSAQFLAVDAALYFIAATAPRRTSVAAITMSLITLAGYLGTRLLFGWVVGTSAELAVAMTAVIAWLVGRSVHQAHVHAESLRVQATAQAIIGERLRIARELHDMVAHSIGIIALQAGAARRVIDTQPVRAREALGEIETVGRETLSGLRRMLGALRHPEPAHPRETTPITHPKPAQPPQSESSDHPDPVDQKSGAQPNPAQPSQSQSSGRSMPADQKPGALPDRPTRPEHRRDASSSRSAPVEEAPAQRTPVELGSGAPFGGSAVLGEGFGWSASVEVGSGAPFGGSAVIEEGFNRRASVELRSGVPLDEPAMAGLIEEGTGRCAPIELGSDGSFGAPASVEEHPDVVLGLPAQIEQGQNASAGLGQPALLSQYGLLSQHASDSQHTSVEPPQRSWSHHPESGQAPPAMPLGQLDFDPTRPTTSLASGLVPLDSGLGPLASGLGPLDPGLGPLDSGLAPAGLVDLERLAATTTAAGVQVQVCWRGVRRPLPPEIDMSAYRIVQEAVTNVTRHAEHPSCQVTIDFGDEELAIEVIDPAPSPHPNLPPPSPGTGPGLGAVPAHSSGSGAGRGFGFGGGCGRGRKRKAEVGYGLVGMRERVALLHGVFSAGPRQEGGFRVVARLPVPARVR
ncbi:sensor histidine kinase [Nonomuraea jabiensis]|uniref:sensor histidine kinase n=1 Tax=Nonomuraea jabiensis TaxID=882448 RepID=UPI00369524A2